MNMTKFITIKARIGTQDNVLSYARYDEKLHIKPSDATAIYDQINANIGKDKDSNIFADLGKEHGHAGDPRYFRFKKVSEAVPEVEHDYTYFDHGRGYNQRAYTCHYNDIWQALPLLQGLYYTNLIKFDALLSNLVENGTDEQRHAFISVLHELNSDLSPEHLTKYSNADQNNLHQKIDALMTYSEQKQHEEGSTKADLALTLCGTLKEAVRANETLAEETDSPNKQLKVLKFKLGLRKLMDEKKPELETHRGYKRLFTNVATVLCTGLVANFINLAVTGNFLFFNKTDTQKKLGKVDNVLSNASPSP